MSSEEAVTVSERLLLRFLCGGRGERQLREETISRLRGYVFRHVEHQVLFDCLRTLPLDRPELIRELLPARLVRAGFPDFDLEAFLKPGEVSDEDARTMCQELVDSQRVASVRKARRAGPSSLRSSG